MTADVGKVTLAGKLRSKLTVKNIRVINKVSGLILLIFGTVLLVGVLFFVKKHIQLNEDLFVFYRCFFITVILYSTTI